MHHFTIRDVENLSGIKAHTLRMWEQRYGLHLCKRKKSLHRYYDNEDLKHILRIAYLYHKGHRISRIAKFSHEEIIQMASKRFENDEYEVMVNQLIEASIDYNQLQFENAFNSALRTMGLEKSMEKVVYPFLEKIGLLWMTGHILPAQEHFSSHLIHKTVIAAINSLPSVYTSTNRFLLFTPEGEGHELPLLFIQYLIKKKGIKTVLLGKNIPLDIVKYYCAHQPVSHLYFHLITNFTNSDPQEYLSKLSETFADKQIIASGPSLKNIGSMPANVAIIDSLQHAISYEFPR
jgi:MerR family transcriptional regulator, light-induced transcriptional regulator